MPSERIQRQIDRLLDEADEAAVCLEWAMVRDRALAALRFDPGNADAQAYLTAAGQDSAGVGDAEVQAASLPNAEPSAFVNGRYQVKKFLGERGKKRVYLAHDTLLDRDVAFALIKTEGLDDAGRQRLTREAQAMGRLGDHPHIVTVYDLGTEPPLPPGAESSEGSQPFIVTPLMGDDVEGLNDKAPEHRLPLERAIEIGQQVCCGLEYAHGHGVVHRDLKPGNVWLTADGTAKLGDFGLAVALDRSRLTQAGMMVGTVSYMPPEQAMGGEVSPRSDLYSLGAMLYELVTGRPPFVGDETVAIIGQHLIMRLLEKGPSKRPARPKRCWRRWGPLNLTPRPPSLSG